MFQMYQQALKNQSDPMNMLKQITGNFKPEQKQQFMQQAKQMGFSEDILKQI